MGKWKDINVDCAYKATLNPANPIWARTAEAFHEPKPIGGSLTEITISFQERPAYKNKHVQFKHV